MNTDASEDIQAVSARCAALCRQIDQLPSGDLLASESPLRVLLVSCATVRKSLAVVQSYTWSSNQRYNEVVLAAGVVFDEWLGALDRQRPSEAGESVQEDGEGTDAFIGDVIPARTSTPLQSPALHNSVLHWYDLSQTDELTGLLNRRGGFSAAQQAVVRCLQQRLPVSVVFLDVNRLKEINDACGHRCGDHILAGLGKVLRASIRTIDVAVRYGGDEFVVVLPECSLANARHTWQRRFLAAWHEEQVAWRRGEASEGVKHGEVSDPIFSALDAQVSVAVGFAGCEATGLGKSAHALPDVADLFAAADDDMYLAKAAMSASLS
jgi:diguanylate cyclase (GGDEF)-like protein